MSSYLPTSGGSVSGNLNVGGTLYASNVSALAGYMSVYAIENHTSNLVINNAGTGPALLVTQSETGPMGAQPVAQFFNGTGTAALVIDNNGNVGVNKPTASAELDVSGAVHATSFVGVGFDGVGDWVGVANEFEQRLHSCWFECRHRHDESGDWSRRLRCR